MSESTDILIGKNLAKLRGSMSMDMLAARMRDIGYRWNKATVYKVEHGERSLKLQEAVDVLNCLGMDSSEDLSKLVASDTDARAVKRITALRNLVESMNRGCIEIIQKRYELSWYIDESLREPLPNDGHWALPSNAVLEKVRRILDETDPGILIVQFREELGIAPSPATAAAWADIDSSQERE